MVRDRLKIKQIIRLSFLFCIILLGLTITVNASARNFFKDKELPIEFSNEDISFTVNGQYLRDYRYYFENNSDLDSTAVTRAARVPMKFSYQNSSVTFVPELSEANGTEEIFDLFFTQKFNENINFRVGKVKLPITLEWTQSIADISFVERLYPTYLLPARDVGAYIFGELFNKKLEYFSGIFYGTTDMNNRNSDVDDNKDFKSKLIYKPLDKLGVGLGFAYGKREGKASNTNLPSYRSMGQQRIFSYNNGVVANGDNIRVIPQAYYSFDSYRIMAEYVYGTSEVLNLNNNTSASLNHSAYSIIFSHAITGEEMNFLGKIKPRKKFSFKTGNYGAFIANLAITGTKLDESSFAGFATAANSVEQAETIVFGLDWIINSNLKLKTQLNLTEFESANGAANRESEKSLLSRLQIVF